MAAENLSNEEIRNQLISFGYNPGPVTETTRTIHLKKLEDLRNNKQGRTNGTSAKHEALINSLTDDEIREQLLAYGQTVAPITSVNRDVYKKRLLKLKIESSHSNNNVTGSSNKINRRGKHHVNVTYENHEHDNENSDENCEPMEID